MKRIESRKLIEFLDKIDTSLDKILLDEGRLSEAYIDQAITWISKAALAGKDIDALVRSRSFVDFSKLMSDDGRPIVTLDDLNQALEDEAATDLVAETIRAAFEDYKKYGYNSNTKAAKIGKKFAGPSASDLMYAANRGASSNIPR